MAQKKIVDNNGPERKEPARGNVLHVYRDALLRLTLDFYRRDSLHQARMYSSDINAVHI